jgi:hypothetical protein
MSLRGASLATVLTVAAVSVAGSSVSKQHAESFLRKVSLIQQHAPPDGRAAGRRTTVSEAELNSWFTYHAGESLPTGVTRPQITILGNQRVIGKAVVDLDAVASSRRSGRTFDIWNLVGGRMPLTVSGIVHARGGRARFEMQEAEVSGVPMPRRLVEELVDYYSRSPDHPDGLRLDQEFELPAGIQRIETSPGAAVVVQ